MQNIWGGANVWRKECVPENALSRKFLDSSKRASGLLCRGILYRKNRALTPEGGDKTYRTRGGPKPLLGRGVIREVFQPPLFSTPPWHPLNKTAGNNFDSIGSASGKMSSNFVTRPKYSPPTARQLSVFWPHLPCEIAEANFWQFQWFSPRFWSTFNPFRLFSVYFNQFQSVSISFNPFLSVLISFNQFDSVKNAVIY